MLHSQWLFSEIYCRLTRPEPGRSVSSASKITLEINNIRISNGNLMRPVLRTGEPRMLFLKIEAINELYATKVIYQNIRLPDERV